MNKRCLMFYPWNLDTPSGARALLLSYSRALKEAGYRLDCFAPKGAVDHGVFENVFVAPDQDSPVASDLGVIGGMLDDPLLPEKIGRDEASMAAAGVLASISNYDVVGIHYTRCHSLRQMLPAGMPTVMFTHDLDSLVACQEAAIYGTQPKFELADEVSRLKPFDLVTVVGPDDRRALHSVDPELPIVEAPFIPAVQQCVRVHEQSQGLLLWISSAAAFHRFSFFWFWTKVWPTIREVRPECKLLVAGRMSEFAKRLGAGKDPQVSLLGMVTDAERLYREADIMIAPYYFGLGIKTKVIEALAAGIPVATTSCGIYNTHIQPGREALVSDDALEYANQVIKLISYPSLRSELAGNGLDYIHRFHDPRMALNPFVEAFKKVTLSKTKSTRSSARALKHLEKSLRPLAAAAVQRCENDGVRTIAIYGAGSHTKVLVPLWKDLGGPAIQNIIVTGEPAESTLMELPVLGANRFDPSRVDGIVISSQEYEQEMAGICSERWPDMKLYSIWQSLNPALDFESVCHKTIPTL